MSLKKIIRVQCPHCKKEYSFTMWESVNTTENPEMKSTVKDRSIFLFKCPNCQKETYADYDFVYHQMENKIMIFYCKTVEKAMEAASLF